MKRHCEGSITEAICLSRNNTRYVVKKGQTISNLVFIVKNGKEIKLSEYKDKVVFVNFFANWCLPCKAEMPHLEKSTAIGYDKKFRWSCNFKC